MSEVWRRIAGAEARAHTRYGLSARFGPLQAVYAGAGLPLNTAWHDGTHPPSEPEVLAFEQFAQQHGLIPTLHVLSPAVPEVLPVLNARGYRLSYLLHLYVHDLQHLSPETSLSIFETTDALAWAATAAQGFGPGNETIMRVVAQAPGTRLFVNQSGKAWAGTAALSVTGDIAALHGTSTLPQYRRQGIQAGLLLARLQAAAQAEATLATVYVTPGTPSERNIQRAGFKLLGGRLTFTADRA